MQTNSPKGGVRMKNYEISFIIRPDLEKDAVDKIAKDTKVEDDNGTVLPENQPIINSIKVL